MLTTITTGGTRLMPAGIPFDWRKARSLLGLEERLRHFLFDHSASSIDTIRDPDSQAEARTLEAQVQAERDRLKLLATTRALAHMAKAHDKRKAAGAEASKRFRADRIAKARRALAECHGNVSRTARLLGWSMSTLDKYRKLIAEEDVTTPVDRCPLCQHELTSLDGPGQPTC